MTCYKGMMDIREARALEREQAGYERGRRDGERALSEMLLRQRAELLELQSGILDSLQRSVGKVAQACEKELIGLAVAVAEKIVGGMPISVQMMESVIHEALGQVEESASFVIQLHAEDLALLRASNSPVLLPNGGVERMDFQPSDSVSRGGCMVTTRFGTIDARREVKVEMLRKALLS